jgi:glycosyltransferase involved in cell wall biosynthesis
MKLLIDLQGAQTESRYRGIGRQARALAVNLIRAAGSHDVHILLNSELHDDLEKLCRELVKVLPEENIKFFGIPGSVKEIDQSNLWRMRAAELYRESVIADLEPDVVYLSSLFEGAVDNAVTSIGLMQAKHATSATLFDLIPLYDPQTHLAADFMRNFYYRRLQSLKRADGLVAISESAKAEAVSMLQFPPERIDVALLAADSAFRKVNLSVEKANELRLRYRLPESFIFYVGAIEPRKNISLIIEAFSKLTPDQRGDTYLVFGGRLHESESMQLQTAAVRFGVDLSRLLLPGFIAEEDLAPLYGLSSLFVFPSTREGFGLPPLEAMACGTPVLVARNSSLPEVVGREDQLFGTFDANELATKMGRILTDKNYSNELRAWGIERAEKFNWSKTGSLTLESLERLHERHSDSKRTQVYFKRRLRLAFVSPLPSDQSGIASYGSELLRELACYYDIECIISGTIVNDPWVIANFAIRDVDYFRRNADSYDRILYQVGNSEFHSHMFDLIPEIPGIVILHDFFISGVLDWLGNVGRSTKNYFLQQLYLTHGYPALFYAQKEGRHASAQKYPVNRIIFDNSHGIIVHSRWSIEEASKIYGVSANARMIEIPQLRAMGSERDQLGARKRLGIAGDAFVVATFGFVADTKLSDRLLEAWGLSAAASAGGTLLFVGGHPTGLWGEEFNQSLKRMAVKYNVSVTGFTSESVYDDYLSSTDIAIQLRSNTRGETSRAVLDCMATGLPIIVNSHGTFAELDPGVVQKIPDLFTVQQLVAAIDELYFNADRRATLGAAGRRLVADQHHPAKVGATVYDTIERFSTAVPSGRQTELIKAVGELYAPAFPSDGDILRLARAVSKSKGRFGLRRIYYDVTVLAQGDLHTGVERVVRSVLNKFIRSAPMGYVLEPVRFENGELHFARAFVAEKFQIASDVLPDTPIDYDLGDIYFTIEWAAEVLPRMVSYLKEFKRAGGSVVIGIHDLLPLIIPHRFPSFIPELAQNWFRSALELADRFVCVSQSVAQDVVRFGNALAPKRETPIAVNYFHIGSDIASSIPTKGLPSNSSELLKQLSSRRTFIMVGTLEPRKGHRQVVDAFHLLWSRNVDVTLVLVGREGWAMDSTVRTIESSRELGDRLHWIRDASDEYLENLYKSSIALIAASEGEGFGLPLIEAAARGIPLLARDLPVFREIAGEHAYYFASETSAELAEAIMEWLNLAEADMAPSPIGVRTLHWEESVKRLQDAMFSRDSFGIISGR